MINWPLVKLGKVLRRADRFEEKDELTEYRFAGTFSFGRGIFVGETKAGSTFRLPKIQRVKSGDFIYCKIMAWEGAFGVAPPEVDGCVLSGAFVVYEIDKELLHPRYLDYYFKIKSVWEQIGSQSTGTNVRRRSLHPDQFEIAEIPLPPLSEQRRIVARIEQLAAKIEEARNARKSSQRAITALYETGSTQCFNFHDNDKRVRDFAKVVGGYAFKSDLYDENGSYQIVRIGNIRDGYLDLTRSPVYWNYSTDDVRISKYLLAENDLVISMTGTRNKRDYGYVAIVPASQKLLLNQRVGKIELKAGIDTRYMFHFLRSRFFRDRLFPKATGTANQANIGNEHIEQVPFVPPFLDEQRRIVAYLDGLQAQVDRLKTLQAQTAAELEALLPSILDKAFKGEL